MRNVVSIFRSSKIWAATTILSKQFLDLKICGHKNQSCAGSISSSLAGVFIPPHSEKYEAELSITKTTGTKTQQWQSWAATTWQTHCLWSAGASRRHLLLIHILRAVWIHSWSKFIPKWDFLAEMWRSNKLVIHPFLCWLSRTSLLLDKWLFRMSLYSVDWLIYSYFALYCFSGGI